MPTFTYRAKTETADEATGVLEAPTVTEAARALRGRGLWPVEIQVQKGSDPITFQKKRGQTPFSRAELALMAQQLSQALAAGVPLVKALQLLAESRHRHVAPVAARLASQVLQGVALAESAAQMPQAFPAWAVALLRAGEAGGALEEALTRIAELAERDAELIAKVRGALAYPAFVLTLGVATLLVLLVAAVPRLAQVFTDLRVPLPWLTQVIIGVSRGLSQGLVWIVPGLLLIAWWGHWRGWLRRAAAIAAEPLRRLPPVQRLLARADLARWTGTVGLLLSQGLPLTEALRLGQGVVTLPQHRQGFSRGVSEVTEGLSLAQTLQRAGIGDPFLQTLVAVGEAEGDLARNLLQASAGYRRQVDQVIKVFTALIEPAMVVVVGLVVGAIVFAMLLPIFNMGTAIR